MIVIYYILGCNIKLWTSRHIFVIFRPAEKKGRMIKEILEGIVRGDSMRLYVKSGKPEDLEKLRALMEQMARTCGSAQRFNCNSITWPDGQMYLDLRIGDIPNGQRQALCGLLSQFGDDPTNTIKPIS